MKINIIEKERKKNKNAALCSSQKAGRVVSPDKYKR
jgi:hypothetical protein